MYCSKTIRIASCSAKSLDPLLATGLFKLVLLWFSVYITAPVPHGCNIFDVFFHEIFPRPFISRKTFNALFVPFCTVSVCM